MVWKLHRVWLETLHLSVEVSLRELETGRKYDKVIFWLSLKIKIDKARYAHIASVVDLRKQAKYKRR